MQVVFNLNWMPPPQVREQGLYSSSEDVVAICQINIKDIIASTTVTVNERRAPNVKLNVNFALIWYMLTALSLVHVRVISFVSL